MKSAQTDLRNAQDLCSSSGPTAVLLSLVMSTLVGLLIKHLITFEFARLLAKARSFILQINSSNMAAHMSLLLLMQTLLV